MQQNLWNLKNIPLGKILPMAEMVAKGISESMEYEA